jgi:hypothetical protein
VYACHASDIVIVHEIDLYAFSNSSMAGPIFMKFVMDITWYTSPNSLFLIFYNWFSNVMDAQSRVVG